MLVGAFGDPGLAALRQREPSRSIIGLGEAGLHAAATGERRFAVVTLGIAMVDPLSKRAAKLGIADLLVGVTILAVSIERLVAARDAHERHIAEVVERSFKHDGADAVLLGGAPFAGLAAKLQPRFTKPVLDGVAASIAAVSA